MNTSYVTASELAEYIYCECCWVDKIEGEHQETEEMLRGTEAHNSLQWQYQVIAFVKQVAIIVVIGCGVLLGLTVIVSFLLNS